MYKFNKTAHQKYHVHNLLTKGDSAASIDDYDTSVEFYVRWLN